METLNIPLEDFGVTKHPNNNETQQELLKMIYATTPKKAEIYLETLKFIDKITQA